jgi:hypothetical protein
VITTGAIASACSGTAPTVAAPALERVPQPAPSGSLPASGSCASTEARWTIGQQRSEDLLERARVAANATVARFLLPNQPITMEYLGSRLNLELDERNLVRDVRCG